VEVASPLAGVPMMRSSIPLFDGLADHYDRHFAVAHRRAYDTLAWERVSTLLPARPGVVVDAGCGVGRWATRFAALGHRVVAIDHAPRMVAGARERLPIDRCAVVHASIEEANVEEASADLVVAMGSVQYTRDPERVIERFGRWVRPGGSVAVLVDSLVAMAVEKIRAGRHEHGLAEARERRGVWEQDDAAADLHLLDRARLEAAFRRGGLADIRSAGLLVTATIFGLPWVFERLGTAADDLLALEQNLMDEPALADLGKQLLVVGHRRD
jgi:SAM-dependent methyltransferase